MLVYLLKIAALSPNPGKNFSTGDVPKCDQTISFIIIKLGRGCCLVGL